MSTPKPHQNHTNLTPTELAKLTEAQGIARFGLMKWRIVVAMLEQNGLKPREQNGLKPRE